jgi:hypothetical protein
MMSLCVAAAKQHLHAQKTYYSMQDQYPSFHAFEKQRVFRDLSDAELLGMKSKPT